MEPHPTTQTVIYRSKRHHTTKRNIEIFKTSDFIAAVIDQRPDLTHVADVCRAVEYRPFIGADPDRWC